MPGGKILPHPWLAWRHRDFYHALASPSIIPLHRHHKHREYHVNHKCCTFGGSCGRSDHFHREYHVNHKCCPFGRSCGQSDHFHPPNSYTLPHLRRSLTWRARALQITWVTYRDLRRNNIIRFLRPSSFSELSSLGLWNPFSHRNPKCRRQQTRVP